MGPQEFYGAVVEATQVTSQKVLIAKRFIIEQSPQNALPSSLLQTFLKKMDSSSSDETIFFYPGNDLEPAIKKMADTVSWRLAFHEALWSLVHSGSLLLSSPGSDPNYRPLKFRFYEGHPDSQRSARADSRDFEEFPMFLPGAIVMSRINDGDQILSNSDIYLSEIDIPGLHAGVREALQEAVRCFRNELFLSSAVMVGRAVEGVLHEVCSALVKVSIVHGKLEDSPSFVQLIRFASNSLEISQAKQLLKLAQISIGQVRDTISWSQVVRDARNAIHYRAVAATGTDYEKVAALLMGVPSNLKILYSIIEGCAAISTSAEPAK